MKTTLILLIAAVALWLLIATTLTQHTGGALCQL